MIKTPKSAYQFYLMSWKDLSEEEKKPFQEKAKKDKEKYETEKKALDEIEYKKTRKLRIFLSRSYNRVPCVGMDNGFESYQTVGPAEKVEEYSEQELLELDEKNIPRVKFKSITINGCTYPHNKRSGNKWNVRVYGYGGIKCKDYWWDVSENYEGEAGKETHYHNYMGNKWVEKY